MRGAKAKALRRLARKATEGAPSRAYFSRQHTRTRVVKSVVEAKPEEKGFLKLVGGAIKRMKRVERTVRVTSEEMRLDPVSTKGFYKHLKRKLKRGGL